MQNCKILLETKVKKHKSETSFLMSFCKTTNYVLSMEKKDFNLCKLKNGNWNGVV